MYPAKDCTHAAALLHPGDTMVKITGADKHVVEIGRNAGHIVGSQGDAVRSHGHGGQTKKPAARDAHGQWVFQFRIVTVTPESQSNCKIHGPLPCDGVCTSAWQAALHGSAAK